MSHIRLQDSEYMNVMLSPPSLVGHVGLVQDPDHESASCTFVDAMAWTESLLAVFCIDSALGPLHIPSQS